MSYPNRYSNWNWGQIRHCTQTSRVHGRRQNSSHKKTSTHYFQQQSIWSGQYRVELVRSQSKGRASNCGNHVNPWSKPCNVHHHTRSRVIGSTRNASPQQSRAHDGPSELCDHVENHSPRRYLSLEHQSKRDCWINVSARDGSNIECQYDNR